MKKKGFTLVELMGVITVLGLITLLVAPTIINQIRNSKDKIDNITKKLIYSATDLYLDNKEGDYPKNNGSTYCLTLKDLVEDGKLSSPVLDSNGDEISLDKYVNIQVENKSYMYFLDDQCKGNYTDVVLNGADPILKEGMLPVIISADGTVKKADMTEEWYNYTNKNWANAVLVKNNSRSKYTTMKSGNTIAESDILAYFVWIPRYRYKLWYTEAIDDDSGYRDESKVHSINIIFESKNTAKSNGSVNGTYLTHPAFTFGDEELNGIWVGKFETGYNGATTTTEAEVNIEDSSKVIIKPNTYSWRNISLSNAFYTTLNMNGDETLFGLNTDSDTHIMKNIEWGAVTYLAYSKYGKDSEVYINNNNNYLTGCGGNTADDSSSSSCLNQYGTKNNNEYNQSTTGNITGIFDMNGGSWDYVMGYTIGADTQYCVSGFTVETFPEDKYVDIYTATNNLQYSNRILGDATGEMGPFSSYKTSWYSDGGQFINASAPWFSRGGHLADKSHAGITYFDDFWGNNGDSMSFRITIS